MEKALAAVPGVRSASVNLASDRASLEHDGGAAVEQLRQAVEAAGYGVGGIVRAGDERRLARERERLEEDQRKVAAAKRRMTWAWALTAPIIAWMIPEMVFGVMWPSPLVYHTGMLALAAPILFV